MTDAEQALADGIGDTLADAFATRGTFTLDGVAGTWAGVCTEHRRDFTAEAGGYGVDAELVIVMKRADLDAAEVTLRIGQCLTYRGKRWSIRGLPYSDDPALVEITCKPVEGRR